MAYNLRREYLIAHKDFVNRLIRLADTNQWAKVVCKSPEEAQDLQYLVNNLLYSLCRYEPGQAHVRRKVRTKIEWEPGGEIAVYMGVPPAGFKLRGPQPVPVEVTAAVPSSQLTIEDEITSETWPTVLVSLTAAAKNPTITMVVIRKPPSADGIRYLAEMLSGHGFTLDHASPEMVLRRK